MERIKRLNWYQKSILIFMLAMALVFAVVYHMTIARVGVLYQNAIFVPAEENGVTVYSGKLRGKQGRPMVPIRSKKTRRRGRRMSSDARS